MKKFIGKAMLIMCLIGCLTACSRESKKSPADAWWNLSTREESVRKYVEKHMDELDAEVLKEAAGGDGYTTKQQFHAIVLLCEWEFRKHINDDPDVDQFMTSSKLSIDKGDDRYHYDYPVSGDYVKQFLQQVNTADSKFWQALDMSEQSYNYFTQFFAALDDIDKEALAQLTLHMPEKYLAVHEKHMKTAVEKWFLEKPDKYLEFGPDYILKHQQIQKTYGPMMKMKF
ncbi:MAG: hypothetical protein ACRDBO_13555 [Lachnospiraceae bacterium]